MSISLPKSWNFARLLNKTAKALSYASLVTTIVSCGNGDPRKNYSDIKWGVHQAGLSANLLTLLPNQSVEICAQTTEQKDYTESAIQKWSSAINRWNHIKINDCGSSSNLVINVAGFGQTGLNYFTQKPGQIYANSQATGKFLEAILLHEIGHSWGLCDQYTDVGSAGCSNNRGPMQDNSEVMGTTDGPKLDLRKGDIDGITYAASLESPANDAWKTLLLQQ